QIRGDQDGADVVDVGERRAGDEQIAEGGEQRVAVVPVQQRAGIEAVRAGAGERVGRDDGAGGVLGAVDAVGVAGGGAAGGLGGGAERHGGGGDQAKLGVRQLAGFWRLVRILRQPRGDLRRDA